MTPKNKKKRQLFIAWLILLGCIASLAGFIAFLTRGDAGSSVAAVPRPATPMPRPADPGSLSAQSLEGVYNQVAAAVEKVTVSVTSEGTSSAVGSGVVVNGRYVLTNDHVVRGANAIRITTFHPTKSYRATVERVDVQNDLALLRLDTNEVLPSAQLGDSAKVDVGDIVFAAGSPFGFGNTFTQGNISDRRQSFTVAGRSLHDMLQTNTAIHPGSSGGPLVNLAGEVIGITTVVYAPKGNYTGIGFAVPINRAASLLRQAGPTVAAPVDGMQPARLPCMIAPPPVQPDLTLVAMPTIGQRYEPVVYRCPRCDAYAQLGCPSCGKPLGRDPTAADPANVPAYLVCPSRHAVPTSQIAPKCPRCGGPMMSAPRSDAAGLVV